MITSFYLVAATAVTVAMLGAACDQPDQAKEKWEAAELSAQYDAEDEAERALFSNAAKADAEIERRLNQFISTRDGMFLVRETRRSDPEAIVGWHTLPLSTPWRASCVRGRLEFSIGPQDKEGGDVIAPPRFARVRLPEEHCERLVLTVGRMITRLTRP